MTKKEEKAQAIRAAKYEAFKRKVQTLTGHVAKRISEPTMIMAFNAGDTAEAFAAQIASREPVGKALHVAKADAVKAAADAAREHIERVRADLEKHGWDRNAAAPYPKYSDHSFAAEVARNKHNNYCRLTSCDMTNGYQTARPGQPYIVVMDDDSVARYIEGQERTAAFYYDAFIVKMVAKVGECVSASVDGSHVWSHSILTVTKADRVEHWKTQQITNVCRYGIRNG